MTLLVVLVIWVAVSPVVALLCCAFIKAGRGPELDLPSRALPLVTRGGTAQAHSDSEASGPEGIAA